MKQMGRVSQGKQRGVDMLAVLSIGAVADTIPSEQTIIELECHNVAQLV